MSEEENERERVTGEEKEEKEARNSMTFITSGQKDYLHKLQIVWKIFQHKKRITHAFPKKRGLDLRLFETEPIYNTTLKQH